MSKRDPFAGLVVSAMPQIPPDRGFTQDEFAKRFSLNIWMAGDEIRRLVKSGEIRYIGNRSGKGGHKVYEVVRK